MKPFDGGGWRGVSRINDARRPAQAYDESGEMLMHLQATVDYDHFARALSIGPETMVMDFRPEQPMHNRYAVQPRLPAPVRRASRPSRSAASSTRSSAGSSTPRDAGRGRRRLPDRLRQRLPRRRGDLAALLLPVGDHGAGALVGVLPRHRPHGPTRPRDAPLLRRSPTDPTSPTRRSSTRYLALADEHFETERYWDWCEPAPRRTSTRRSSSGSPSTTSTGCCVDDRAGDLPGARAASSSWPTSAA